MSIWAFVGIALGMVLVRTFVNAMWGGSDWLAFAYAVALFALLVVALLRYDIKPRKRGNR
jgi:membrane protein DedA with SNARE-associated domain